MQDITADEIYVENVSLDSVFVRNKFDSQNLLINKK